ncbi:MAG TPA: FeoA domain-containing protein [Burkholderiaceae bacterium]|nr:FeoA domain-containing protein [Burkholderiaceae bacterium]
MSTPSHPTPLFRSLDQWPLQTDAQVASLATPADAEQAHTLLRLMEIGFLPGETVRPLARGSLGGDPLAVRVGRSTFALRKHEAALIQVAQVGGAA